MPNKIGKSLIWGDQIKMNPMKHQIEFLDASKASSPKTISKMPNQDSYNRSDESDKSRFAALISGSRGK